MAIHEALPSKKHLPFGGARAINNPVIEEFIRYVHTPELMDMVRSNYLIDNFLKKYRSWLMNSQLNDLRGLDSFPYASYSNGTTEAFDKWYLRHHGRRLRMFRGEYMYHLATHRNLGLEYAWLEDEPLSADDHVIISMPFADNGGQRPETKNILDSAAIMGVPVMIDAAYLGTTQGLDFDFSHPAIDTVVTSLSKAFPVAHARIGMRLCRTDLDDGLDIYRKTAYENRWGAALGTLLIGGYGQDYNALTYGEWHRIRCMEMGLERSHSVMFGLGGSEYDDYNRGGLYNRLYLGGLYEK